MHSVGQEQYYKLWCYICLNSFVVARRVIDILHHIRVHFDQSQNTQPGGKLASYIRRGGPEGQACNVVGERCDRRSTYMTWRAVWSVGCGTACPSPSVWQYYCALFMHDPTLQRHPCHIGMHAWIDEHKLEASFMIARPELPTQPMRHAVTPTACMHTKEGGPVVSLQACSRLCPSPALVDSCRAWNDLYY